MGKNTLVVMGCSMTEGQGCWGDFNKQITKVEDILKLRKKYICPSIVLDTSMVGPKANSQPELFERNPFKMVRFGMNLFDSRPEIIGTISAKACQLPVVMYAFSNW